MITDLQGVGPILTDPSVQTKNNGHFNLSHTNLGHDGFKFFFSTHKCNAICASLRLKSTREMVASNSCKFRSDWPRGGKKLVNMCCANKLCGRILNGKTAKRWKEWADYLWCEACGPQVVDSKVWRVCESEEGKGEGHQFEVSKFFYESQGMIAPTVCGECSKGRSREDGSREGGSQKGGCQKSGK